MCVLTLLIGGLLAYMFVFRNRRPSIASNRPAADVSGRAAEPAVTYPEGQEPPKPDPLLADDRVITTPHIGGLTHESVERAVQAAVDNLLRELA